VGFDLGIDSFDPISAGKAMHKVGGKKKDGGIVLHEML
jgi:hypothetical protein